MIFFFVIFYFFQHLGYNTYNTTQHITLLTIRYMYINWHVEVVFISLQGLISRLYANYSVPIAYFLNTLMSIIGEIGEIPVFLETKSVLSLSTEL